MYPSVFSNFFLLECDRNLSYLAFAVYNGACENRENF